MDELKVVVLVLLKVDTPSWNWTRNQRTGETVVPDKQLPVAEPNDPAVVVPSQPLPRIPGLPAGMTCRHCPSCESGMSAPGTRHSAECRKRQAELLSDPIKPSLEDVENEVGWRRPLLTIFGS